MTLRSLIFGCALGALIAGTTGAQTIAAGAPAGHWAPLQTPPNPGEKLTIAAQLQGQFANSRRSLTALVERMPAEHFGFRPVPAMRTFGESVAHVISSSFSYCANLTGLPNPHKGEDLEKAVATKDDAIRLLKESFDYCGQFAAKPTTDALLGTYQANTTGPDGQKGSIAVERGGLFANYLEHNNEMYGYLSVYLRLKGLVPPSSDPRPARGRVGGAGR
jgi:hypothetical protein